MLSLAQKCAVWPDALANCSPVVYRTCRFCRLGLMAVTVREFKEGDTETVQQIWTDGLQQTVDSSSFWIRPFIRGLMGYLASTAVTGNGDMANISARWGGDDRQMFVAVSDLTVVGCVGVKHSDGDTCTVWRLSVAEPYRRSGVACALMQRAERWCLERKGRKIQLETGNPIAASFYVSKCGFRKLGFTEAIGPWYEKSLKSETSR